VAGVNNPPNVDLAGRCESSAPVVHDREEARHRSGQTGHRIDRTRWVEQHLVRRSTCSAATRPPGIFETPSMISAPAMPLVIWTSGAAGDADGTNSALGMITGDGDLDIVTLPGSIDRKMLSEIPAGLT